MAAYILLKRNTVQKSFIYFTKLGLEFSKTNEMNKGQTINTSDNIWQQRQLIQKLLNATILSKKLHFFKLNTNLSRFLKFE